MEHPIVQQAQQLFHAEIQNVIDLSETTSEPVSNRNYRSNPMNFSDLGKMKE